MLADSVQAPSDDEARRLFELARQKSEHGRQMLYAAIADMFERRSGELDDLECTLMCDILERLSRDVEMSVRAKLAQRLAHRADVPPQLIRLLANDDVQVSYEVLAASPVLRDADLIEIIRHRTMQHHLAVAIRKDLSEDVSTALVETGSEDVIVALLNNQDARISSAVLEYLAEESRRVDAYQKPLVRRPELPESVAQKMYAWVSASVRKYIVENFDVNIHDLDDALSDVVDEEISQPLADDSDAVVKLVDNLFDSGQLSIAIAFKALQQGQISLFEYAFAKLSGLRPVLAQRIIYEPGGEAFAIACRALGLERSAFLQIYRMTRKARVAKVAISKREMVKLSQLFEGMTRENAFLVLRRWQRNPVFLDSLRQTGQDDC